MRIRGPLSLGHIRTEEQKEGRKEREEQVEEKSKGFINAEGENRH